MKTLSRNLHRLTPVVPLALVLFFLFQNSLAAQQPQRAQRKVSRPAPAAQAQAQEAGRVRRAKAVALLALTADRARSLDDLLYRARLQALAADALYPFDRVRARAVFRLAWEAAAASDKAEREQAAQEAGEAVETLEAVTEARDEVLSQTAARDPALAAFFLRELLKQKEQESNPEQSEREQQTPWHEPSAAAERRIQLGFELLDKGEVESAYSIVAPAADEGASALLVSFLLSLSQQDAAAGESLYRLMIAQARRDSSADANTVLLLSTPIVSPALMVVVDEYGSLQFRPLALAQKNSTPRPAPATRRAFLNTAASVLLRPSIRRTGASEAQDEAARYFAIGRLLPFFEREAAQHVPELQARLNALLNGFTESRRASLSSQLDLRQIGAPPSTDPLRSHFEELARTSDQTERDRITLRIVLIAARTRAWDRARRAAADLSDEGMRRAANSYIAVNQVADLSNAYADEKDDDPAEIVGFLKSVEVPPLAAAWGYAQAARVAARRKEPQAVAELLTEAEHYAGRVDAATSQRVAAYALIVEQAAPLDGQRAWELLTQLVRAANALEDYAGDEASLEIPISENPNADDDTPFTLTSPLFRLDAVFATMAHLDFERALSAASTLDGAVPRLFAQLAIARAMLEKK